MNAILLLPPEARHGNLRSISGNLDFISPRVRDVADFFCYGFLLLSTNLAREWLQIDTNVLLTITGTADELSSGTNIDDLERP